MSTRLICCSVRCSATVRLAATRPLAGEVWERCRAVCLCACDLVEPTGKSQPTVSHHLKVLREAGLVSADRRGSNVWYAAVPAQIDALRQVLTPAG